MCRRFTLSLIILFLFALCCQSPAFAIDKTRIFVSILPQKYFVEKIGGEFVETHVMVKPERSPADYEPSPSQMLMLSKTRAYFAIGVPFENTWLQKFKSINPDMKIVYTEKGIKKKPINRHADAQSLSLGHTIKKHSHHENQINDPHIWLSPPLVMILSNNILNGLISIDPKHTAEFTDNHKKFIKQLIDLDREFKKLFPPDTGHNKFLVFHPSWGYFADAYGLAQISIEIEGKAPKAKEIKDLIHYAAENEIKFIFVQPQFSIRHAEIIAKEIGGQVVFADPLAEDWQQNLQKVVLSIKQALR